MLSSSVRFVSFFCRSQQASSMIAPLASRATPMASESWHSHLNGEFIPVDAPIFSYWIIRSHSSHGFSQHTSQGSISHFIVPSWRHRGCTSFYGHHRHCHRHSSQPSYGKVAHQFATHRKGAPTSDNRRNLRNPNHPSPHEVFLYCLWRVILTPSSYFVEALAPCMSIWNTPNIFNRLGRHNTFIDEDVINVGWCFLNVLVLRFDHFDSYHDIRSHVETKFQSGKTVSDPLDFHELKRSQWLFSVYL